MSVTRPVSSSYVQLVPTPLPYLADSARPQAFIAVYETSALAPCMIFDR